MLHERVSSGSSFEKPAGFSRAQRDGNTIASTWALIPAGLTALLLVVRTALEDRTLLNELEGYRAYAQQTRYRLLPGVW